MPPSSSFMQLIERIDRVGEKLQLYRDEMVQQHSQVVSQITILQADLDRLVQDMGRMIESDRENSNDHKDLWIAIEQMKSHITLLSTTADLVRQSIQIHNHNNAQAGEKAVNRQAGTLYTTNDEWGPEGDTTPETSTEDTEP